MMPGKGKMTVTGNLRDVMKESISAAASYVRSRAVDFGIKPPSFDKRDIHVHVPEGATPKDGPSAGIAMATAIVSVLTGIPVRKDIAMTGEITLRGRVLPIGGLKEKLLAALRGGIKTVLIPEDNVKDLADIPENVKSELEIIPVGRIGQVLEHALTSMPEPIEWTEEVESVGGNVARLTTIASPTWLTEPPGSQKVVNAAEMRRFFLDFRAFSRHFPSAWARIHLWSRLFTVGPSGERREPTDSIEKDYDNEQERACCRRRGKDGSG
jgi:hypothetical protein